MGGGIGHLNCVVVSDCDQNAFSVFGEFDLRLRRTEISDPQLHSRVHDKRDPSPRIQKIAASVLAQTHKPVLASVWESNFHARRLKQLLLAGIALFAYAVACANARGENRGERSRNSLLRQNSPIVTTCKRISFQICDISATEV
jgi:hypothetical protein